MKRSILIVLILIGITSGVSSMNENWVTTWGNGPQKTESRNKPPAPGLPMNSLRQMLRVSIGGENIRIQVSNMFGNSPVEIQAVEIAKSAGLGKIVPGTNVPVFFNGQPGITMEKDTAAWSDSLEFSFAPLEELAVTIYFGEVSSALTGHPGSRTTSYIMQGRHLDIEKFEYKLKTNHWYILTRIDVDAPEGYGAIVTLGDSITDGRGSSTNKNNRWPDNLAVRLQESEEFKHIAVVNMGIGGNAVFSGGLGPKATARFDRDVLDVAGVKWLLILHGVNDIGGSSGKTGVRRTSRKMIEAYKIMIDKAHAAGLLVYGIPILPFAKSNYDTPDHLKIREIVNQWIYTSGEFDVVLPLEQAVLDPYHPETLKSNLDDNDYLHLNVKGYQTMADAIDLELFRE